MTHMIWPTGVDDSKQATVDDLNEAKREINADINELWDKVQSIDAQLATTKACLAGLRDDVDGFSERLGALERVLISYLSEQMSQPVERQSPRIVDQYADKR